MNSECGEHQKKIAAMLLGELPEDDRRALEIHLAACSRCRSEQESYARTIKQLAPTGEEAVPRHFFIYPEPRSLDPWKVFCRMSLRWRVVGVSAVALALALCFAAVLRLQLRSDAAGWTLSFGRDDFDPQAFKRDVLAAAEQQNQASRREWIRQVRSEIARSHLDLTHEQETLLTAALELMDSRIAGRIRSSEGGVREDTQKLVTEMYAMLAQQRAQDLEAINLRFERNDANNAIKAQQTNEILGTLLQVADLGLSKK